MNLKKAVILAGGFGTRLRSKVSNVPKVLAPINGRPFLSYQLQWLHEQGIEEVFIATHYLADLILDFVRRNDYDMNIKCIYEDKPLGTGGAILNVLDKINIYDFFLVINGDTKYTFDLNQSLTSYEMSKDIAYLLASYVSDTTRFGVLNIEGEFVTEFLQPSFNPISGWVNSGMYIFSAEIFKGYTTQHVSLEKEILPNLAKRNCLKILRCPKSDVFFDIGTPESYEEINGKVK